ncbi:hypothetical protein AFE_1269 [Acidithiobacillus ferrooxidans ATCC 23270]|uniref:Uncharacterized protein n=1 Tax=Acidithiobacillus ferrooxidans (strain ATCC 23270 / DSM 14882 / CIP 104768 / NCIMB 8455) TaxID=243159 RepID=B7J8V0_ACIF2|nr:hypothetical protein AFE_1269 [Acidithiobacillus ferrooxidans ATCC 23270]
MMYCVIQPIFNHRDLISSQAEKFDSNLRLQVALNISKKANAQEATKKVDDKIVSGGYAILSFAPFSLLSTHRFAHDVAEELLNGAQLVARSGEDPIVYLRQCKEKGRILDHQAFIRPWRWEDIRLPEPTAPWAF